MTRKMMSPKVLVWAALFTLPAPAWTASVAEQQLVAALGARPDLQHGANLFKACVTCHNSDGSGEFNGDVPAIAGQYRRVLLRQLVDFRYGKRWDVRMEAIASSHYLSGAQNLADVAAYVSALPRLTDPERGDGQLLAHGMQAHPATDRQARAMRERPCRGSLGSTMTICCGRCITPLIIGAQI